MKVAVGLGNPGPRYEENRHNVGFRVMDQLALVLASGPWQKRFEGLLTEGMVGGEKLLLLKPQTYMNRSGLAVRQLIDFYKLTVDSILVIADDFSLPLGKLRLRAKGSAGGQNGLKDIIAHLGTDGVARLRLGIGEPGRADPAEFVLSNFSASEKPIIADSVIESARAAEWWVRHGIMSAMNEFNGQGTVKE